MPAPHFLRPRRGLTASDRHSEVLEPLLWMASNTDFLDEQEGVEGDYPLKSDVLEAITILKVRVDLDLHKYPPL